MDSIVKSFVDDVYDVADEATLCSLLTNTMGKYGIEYFAYLTFSPEEESGKPLSLTTYPAPWVKRYKENRYDQVDPVIARAVASVRPFSWTVDACNEDLTRRQRTFIREAIDFRILHGMTIPIHDRRARSATLNITTYGAQPQFIHRLEAHQHELHLIAIHLHARVREIMWRTTVPSRHPPLTPREITCLQWAARGKSAGDTANIMSISRRTVVFHIENTKHKFGVASVNQAIVQGLTHDLIGP